ncbi:MAG: DUF2867 domain-containing protein [Pseudomonadota bacterium]
MSASVQLTSLPAWSAMLDYCSPGDFIDCYSVECDLSVREAAEIIVQFPSWVQLLMLLREVVTTPFGLKNSLDEGEVSIGIFPIESESDREILAGFDDKHLNFRISIAAEDGKVFLATWVRPHNMGGKLYLSVIMPFHILICRNALGRIANR